MARIFIDIPHCGKCPFVRQERFYTEDSWEHAYDYFCTKQMRDGKPLRVAHYIEWEREMPEVPDSCPQKIC